MDINRPLTDKEIESAFQNLNPHSSPGLSSNPEEFLGTPMILIKAAQEELKGPVHKLLGRLWETGQYPTILKRDRKIFIQKPGKDDYSAPKSYRMLSLLNWLSKIYDYLISVRFSRWMEEIQFDEDQYAYRKYTSCNHGLFYLSQNILESFNRNEATVALLVDLEGAFDAIWHQGLIYQMHKEGLRGKILTVTWNILTNRTAHCEVNDIKETVNCLNTGTCQGSYSAAHFFTFAVRKMMEQINGRKLKYFNDGNSFRSGPDNNIQLIANKISIDLQNMVNWSHKWRLPINLGKTKFMVFSKEPTDNTISVSCQMKHPDCSVKTLNIERTTQERIPGVHYDEQMTFYPHLDKIFTSAMNNINKIRDFIYKQGGLSTQLSVMLYTAYVRTLIESSYPAWCTINEDSLKKLDTIQGIALKMILQLKGKTSYTALDVETGIIPIRLRLKQTLALFGWKLLRKADNNKLKSIMTLNLERKNIGQRVTNADKIRMAMSSMKPRELEYTNIEKEPNMAIQYDSNIKPNLFAWKNYGNAPTRTKDQKEELQQKTIDFLRGHP